MVKVHSIKDKSKQGPVLSWVAVPDSDGRIHMEMRWHVQSRRQHGRRRHSAA
ncbi:hypothetical protein [Ornithinimicrobium cryptoxanthini]|nr:hypothetical protein [Ornithinimicrobium cryptoxanthini]